MESKQKHARLRAYLLESTASYTSGAADMRLIFLTAWKRPMSSSDGVTIGSFDLPNRIDRGESAEEVRFERTELAKVRNISSVVD